MKLFLYVITEGVQMSKVMQMSMVCLIGFASSIQASEGGSDGASQVVAETVQQVSESVAPAVQGAVQGVGSAVAEVVQQAVSNSEGPRSLMTMIGGGLQRGACCMCRGALNNMSVEGLKDVGKYCAPALFVLAYNRWWGTGRRVADLDKRVAQQDEILEKQREALKALMDSVFVQDDRRDSGRILHSLVVQQELCALRDALFTSEKSVDGRVFRREQDARVTQQDEILKRQGEELKALLVAFFKRREDGNLKLRIDKLEKSVFVQENSGPVPHSELVQRKLYELIHELYTAEESADGRPVWKPKFIFARKMEELLARFADHEALLYDTVRGEGAALTVRIPRVVCRDDLRRVEHRNEQMLEDLREQIARLVPVQKKY